MKKTMIAALAAATVMLSAGQAPAADPGPYTPVTDARLQNPEPQNWLMYRANYSGWGYSPLDQVSDQNVGKLKLAWSYSTGMMEGHEAPPIVNNGYMYVATPNNQVIALEAATGKELWRYKKQIPDELQQLHPTSRGVALYGDKVYMATTDAFLVCLDAVSGKELWKVPVADWKAGYYMTLAPMAAKGKIVVGASGGEYGIRGFIAAFDADTGKEDWRTYTIPAPGEKGSETWPKGDQWQHGGGSIWVTGTYDPATNLTFWGTGNAGPWTPAKRPGDNLYANSMLALDLDTGKLKGFHQYHWNDGWDWDEVSSPLLIDVQKDGKTIHGLVHAGRDGYLWVLERTKDKVNYVEAWPFVKQNVFTRLDPKTGRPSYDPDHVMQMNKTVSFCPSLWGGKDWFPEAYSPKTGLFYVPANNNLCAELTDIDSKYSKGELYLGVTLDNILTNVRMTPESKDHIGEVQAWNVNTGKEVWMHKYQYMNWGPLMATGGNLVFGGGTNDRMFHAFNATTGEMLWQWPMSSGVMGTPSSFEVDGVQYIAVQSGWGVDAQRMQGSFDAALGTKTVVPQGGVINVFKLEK